MEHVLTRIRDAVTSFSLPYLRDYFEGLGEFSKWAIVSDYCIGAKGKPNDVAVFTLMPDMGNLAKVDHEVGILLPRDFKKVQEVSDLAIALLKADLFYSFAFLLPKERILFSPGEDQAEGPGLHTAFLNSLAYYEGKVANGDLNSPLVKSYIQKLKKLLPRVKSGSAKHRLLKDIFLVTSLAASIVSVVQEFRVAEQVAWMSDRDNIIRAYDNLAFESFVLCHSWLAEQMGHVSQKTHLIFADPLDVKGKGIWYDSLIRIPDYIAGALADYDLATDQYTKDKVEPVLTALLHDRAHLAVHELVMSPGKFACRNVQFFKKG